MRLLGPRHTVSDVARKLHDGLLSGELTLDHFEVKTVKEPWTLIFFEKLLRPPALATVTSLILLAVVMPSLVPYILVSWKASHGIASSTTKETTELYSQSDAKKTPKKSQKITGKELIERYKRGERKFRVANLEGADLSNINLRNADLYKANLKKAKLKDANLRKVNFVSADLRDADLRDADLRDADLRDADLRDADLRRADFRGTDLRGANLRGCLIRSDRVFRSAMVQEKRRDDEGLAALIREGATPQIGPSRPKDEQRYLLNTLSEISVSIDKKRSFSPR